MKRVLYILGQLTDEDAEWLAAAGTVRALARGETLIREGAALTSMFILIDGALAVTLSGVGELAQLGAGEIVGELSLVDSRPASATVTARDDAVVLEIPRADLQRRMDGDPAFAARLYRAIAVFLADRMRATIRRMGYGGDARAPLAEDQEADGEIDLDLLETVHQAGARFDRIFRGLLRADRRGR